MREIEVTVRIQLYDKIRNGEKVERDDIEADQVCEFINDLVIGAEDAPYFGVTDCAVTDYEAN